MSSSTPPAHSPSDSHPPRPPLQPLPERHYSSPFTSTLHYFTEPFAYTARSVARRLSEDEAPTPLARALSANYNGSLSDTAGGMLTQPFLPPRRLSPFQPPPLTPLQLRGYDDSTRRRARLLDSALAEEVRLLVPPRLQLCEHWDLAYSLEQHGSTLRTLYARCAAYRGKRAGFVLVVRDAAGAVFGAYLTEAPRPQPHYFGTGECFLWRAVRLPGLPDLASLPPPPSADTTHLGRMTTIGLARRGSSSSFSSLGVPNGHHSSAGGADTPDRIRFKAFPYTGENDFSIFCQQDYLSVGGGDGHYGLWLDDRLSTGVSDPCPTFGNERLSDEGSKFDVLGVEVWYIGS